MSMLRALALLAGLFVSCPAAALESAAGAAPPINFAAEDWPPFISASLAGDGLSGTMARAAFARAGYQFKVNYFPWKRTMRLGLTDPAYAGFLAVWRTPEREKLCYFSAPIGNTLTVLAYLKEAPPSASTLEQLQGSKIGTVAGFSNGEQFDTLVRRGVLRVEEGVNDDTNLRKLLKRRFGVIVIEKHVLRHMLMGPQFSDADRARIGISEIFFKERPVHICFKRNAQGLEQQRRFNEAARDIDLLKLERDYWKHAGTPGF